MGLTQLNFEGKNKIEVGIMRLQQFEPEGGYYLAFGGGKDSVVIYDLAEKAGVKFDAHYHLAIDPPELVTFIKRNYPSVLLESNHFNFWKLLVEKGFPLRKRRWCCEYFKEWGGGNRGVVTGVRWEESLRRRGRGMVSRGTKTRFGPAPRFVLNPIIDWTLKEVWEYIKLNSLPYCGLYDEGFKRLGCVLCPMASKRTAMREYARFPKTAEAWRRAFNRLYEAKKDKYSRFESGDEMFESWLTRGRMAKNEYQCEMFL